MKRILIAVAGLALHAELRESITAQKIWDALPLEGRTNVWGDEIYFTIPVAATLESDAQAGVDIGTLGYWEPGQAFCIFFGPTLPASTSSLEQPVLSISSGRFWMMQLYCEMSKMANVSRLLALRNKIPHNELRSLRR